MSPTPPEVVTRYAGHGGLTLAAGQFGDPAAPPVILLHGGGQTRHTWTDTAGRLAAAGFFAVSVDHRGHGDSAWDPEGDYSLEAFAGDVRALVAALARPAGPLPILVGASLGGIAALVAEAESPGPLARALVLVDIAPRMEPEGVARVVGFMTAFPDGFASLEEAADAVAAYLPHRPRPRDHAGLEKNLRRTPAGRYVWHWDPAFVGGRQRPAAASQVERLHRAAGQLRLPTLLVRGRLSDVISEEGAREFLATAPHARYVDVAGAGHMVAGDRNEVFADAIVGFLRELPPPAGS
jgi:non-heme chloroperoxidase